MNSARVSIYLIKYWHENIGHVNLAGQSTFVKDQVSWMLLDVLNYIEDTTDINC